MSKKIFTAFIITATLFAGCFPKKFKDNADKAFGDQYFKTAIALIELYKIREGNYPPTLDSLKYLGNWDKMIFRAVSYQKLDTGYELNLTTGWIGKPKGLGYPADFWKGLGLRKSNLK